MPMSHYAKWISQNLRNLYDNDSLEEHRLRDIKNINGIPFSFHPEDLSTSR